MEEDPASPEPPQRRSENTSATNHWSFLNHLTRRRGKGDRVSD